MTAEICPRCGTLFATAGNMRLYRPAAPKRANVDRNWGAAVFAVLLVMLVWVLRMTWDLGALPPRLDQVVLCVLGAALLIVWWGDLTEYV